VLHLQLKRFRYGPAGLEKLGDSLAFGEHLDLGRWVDKGSPRAAPQGGDTEKGNPEGEALGGSDARADAGETGAAGTETRYRLHAVLVHSGEAEAGHYYAFVRHPTGKSSPSEVSPAEAAHGWARCNDARVSSVPLGVVLAEGAGTEDEGSALGAHRRRWPGRAGVASTGAYLLQFVRVDVIPALLHAPPNDP